MRSAMIERSHDQMIRKPFRCLAPSTKTRPYASVFLLSCVFFSLFLFLFFLLLRKSMCDNCNPCCCHSHPVHFLVCRRSFRVTILRFFVHVFHQRQQAKRGNACLLSVYPYTHSDLSWKSAVGQQLPPFFIISWLNGGTIPVCKKPIKAYNKWPSKSVRTNITILIIWASLLFRSQNAY